MKFKKEFLLELLEEDNYVEHSISDTSRWSVHYDWVFEHDGKFYESSYSVGATEQQEEYPYEYDGDEIECREVVPVKKTITVYEPI